jgi:iron complex transport system permease protein
MKPIAWAALLGLAVVLVFLLSIRLGSVDLSTGEVFAALLGEGDINIRRIVVELRAPRAVMAILVGGGLSLSGAVFQALLRNPLAEPYILGISGGAATGAVLALAMGLAASLSWALPAAAFTGALLAIVLVLRVAATADHGVDVRVLLLAGVVVGAFFTACMSFVLSISDARTVRSAVLWMMGSLAGSDWRTVWMVTLYTLPAAIMLVGLARPLNLLAIGEETAGFLGADVERVKRVAYVLASLLTAAGVAATGVIGFVGLIVPHSVRLLVGGDYRVLLPLAFLTGAVFLTLADIVARTVMSPAEVPIGVITAFVGVPLFLLLLRRSVGAGASHGIGSQMATESTGPAGARVAKRSAR